MKMNLTFSLGAKILALSSFFCAPIVATGQVIFTQNFSSHTSESLTPYIGTGANQFNFLGVIPTTAAGAATTSTIRVANATYPNQLRLFRGTTSCAFARTTDFSPTPNVLKIKFKINVAASTFSTTTTAVFSVGAGFTADAVSEPDANVHSRFGIGFTNNPVDMASYVSGTYVLRNMKSFINTPQLTGQQEITWVINNSGADVSYVNPNGVISSVADDKSDIWFGNSTSGFTLNGNLDGASAFTATQPLTDFKFILSSAGTVVIDDIEISTGDLTIPITLSSFTAKKAGETNQLTWKTETEINNQGYNVERQTAKGTWTSIGFVGGENKPSSYTFEDKTPLSISYYRLRQVDFDGKETVSKVVSVSQDQKGEVRISPNPTSDKINIILSNDDRFESTTITVYDLIGRQVLTQKTTANAVELDMSSLAKGTYLVKIDVDNSIYTEKIIRQ
jgi:Secretion system C-terminal sorting domain